jgi:hypothetical protein
MTIKGEVWEFDNDHGTGNRDLSTRRAKTRGRHLICEKRMLTPARDAGWYGCYKHSYATPKEARAKKAAYLTRGIVALLPTRRRALIAAPEERV